MPKSINMRACKTPFDLKIARMKIENLSSIQMTYDPPCDDMKLIAVIDRQDTYGNKYLVTKFKYMDQNYQEIVNQREFEFQSFWSSVGGFIGIFVGTSLLQVPTLTIDVLNWLRSFKKKN